MAWPPTEAEQQAQDLDDAVAEIMWPGLCTGWLLIAEVIDENGERHLVRLADRSLTPWAQQGFLMTALNEAADQENCDD